MSPTSLPRILPVIHLVMSNNVDDLIKHGLRESNIAFECGADGVFFDLAFWSRSGCVNGGQCVERAIPG